MENHEWVDKILELAEDAEKAKNKKENSDDN